MPRMRAGQIFDSQIQNIFSQVAVGEVAFGVPVSPDAESDRSVHVTTTGDTAIRGVAVMDASVATAADKFDDGDEVRVMDKGVCVVQASTAVNVDDPVTVVAATGAFTTGGANIAVPAKYLDTLGSAGLARIKFN